MPCLCTLSPPAAAAPYPSAVVGGVPGGAAPGSAAAAQQASANASADINGISMWAQPIIDSPGPVSMLGVAGGAHGLPQPVAECPGTASVLGMEGASPGLAAQSTAATSAVQSAAPAPVATVEIRPKDPPLEAYYASIDDMHPNRFPTIATLMRFAGARKAMKASRTAGRDSLALAHKHPGCSGGTSTRWVKELEAFRGRNLPDSTLLLDARRPMYTAPSNAVATG